MKKQHRLIGCVKQKGQVFQVRRIVDFNLILDLIFNLILDLTLKHFLMQLIDGVRLVSQEKEG